MKKKHPAMTPRAPRILALAGAFALASAGATVEEEADALLARIRDESAWRPLAEKWEGQKFSGSPIEQFAFPAEHYDDGRIRAVLRAQRAVIGADETIWAWGVTLVMYDRQGEREGEMEAETCLFDRRTQTGYSAGKVRAVFNETAMTGVDCVWSVRDSFIRMLSEAEIHSAGNPVKEAVK